MVHPFYIKRMNHTSIALFTTLIFFIPMKKKLDWQLLFWILQSNIAALTNLDGASYSREMI